MPRTSLEGLLRSAEESVDSMKRAASFESETQEMQRVADELEKVERDLSNLLSAQHAVSGLAHQLSASDSQLDECKHVWIGLNEEFFAKQTSLSRRQSLRRKIDGELPKLKSAIEASSLTLYADWQTYVDGVIDVQGVQRLASALEGVGVDPRLREIRNLLREAELLRGSLPDSNAVDRLPHLADKLAETLADVVGDEPEVRAFIQAAGGAGASLEQLTPVVLEWLGKQDLLEQFRVVTSRISE